MEMDKSAEQKEHVTLYSPVPAVVSNYHSHWLNWINATSSYKTKPQLSSRGLFLGDSELIFVHYTLFLPHCNNNDVIMRYAIALYDKIDNCIYLCSCRCFS